MSGQQHEKTRERAPANLGIKFNPALGATNSKRFSATVRALLKSNQESGELALAVLEGRANSSKESLVLFEPRATDYAKVLAVLKDTKDEAKALAAGWEGVRRPRWPRCAASSTSVFVCPHSTSRLLTSPRVFFVWNQ